MALPHKFVDIAFIPRLPPEAPPKPEPAPAPAPIKPPQRLCARCGVEDVSIAFCAMYPTGSRYTLYDYEERQCPECFATYGYASPSENK